MAHFHSSVLEVLGRIRREFSGVKLLALGQTVYWDEPMKSVLWLLLDRYYPEAVLVAGIHDADYFSKVPPGAHTFNEWTILPHNDWSTRDLWVATGEISCLFGSETIPTREMFLAHGVQLEKAGRHFAGERNEFLDKVTEAWGWRGLAYAGNADMTACCVKLRDVLPQLLELIHWAFEATLNCLAESARFRAEKVCSELLSDVQDYASKYPEATVTDMYRHFLPAFYARLTRRRPVGMETTSSCRLFRFNSSTVHLPRFDLVRAFLDPKTRKQCQEAYDSALEGSDIYTLDRFCEGAIPFDLVVPGVGRGTICLQDDRVVIDMPEHVHIESTQPVTTLEMLAELVEERFGPDVSLVGKAVTLILTASREFIFVMNEQASAYVWRCKKMADLLKDSGLDLGFHPILRLDYGAWDAVGASEVEFILPDHLARAFGRKEITAGDFAQSWRHVVAEQEKTLKEVAALDSLDVAIAFLAERFGEPWVTKMHQHLDASVYLRELAERTAPLKQESINLRDLSHRLKQEAHHLEIEKGRHFRRSIKPVRDRLSELEAMGSKDSQEIEFLRLSLEKAEKERSRLESEIERLHAEGIHARNKHLEIKAKVASMERSNEAVHARALIKAIEQEVELVKIDLVRDAFLVSKGLVYTNHRPCAWWFMVADPTMKWFDRVAEITKLRLEELGGETNA